MAERTHQSLPEWRALEAHHRNARDWHLRELFDADPDRFDRFSVSACGLLLDYSKNRASEETLTLLLDLARAVDLRGRVNALFRGERVNVTEGRAALHMALRAPADRPFPDAANDVMPEVEGVRARMRAFVAEVREGRWLGHSGKPIRDVVNIGIGGSDLGPKLVTHALADLEGVGIRAHFVSNLDSTELEGVLAGLDPGTSLFVVSSKTFGTQETLTNARSARAWLLAAGGFSEAAVARHFAAVSANPARAGDFGIDAANVFGFWDWVGGRYSLWSAIGLSSAMALGMDRFESLLAGAHEMDRHFRDTPLDENLPVVLGLLSVWYRDFFATSTQAVLPYDYALRDLPAYLQQLHMESNGKQVTLQGDAVGYATEPIIWGAPGNNGQHAFYQLLHQGTELVPSDFIVPARLRSALPHLGAGHEAGVIANALAQTRALMIGKTEDEVREELAASGLAGEALERQLPHRLMPGNRPTNTIVYERLTPRVLGALIALYEHKVFVESVCWGINAFDQWGVELGKQIARSIEPRVSAAHDEPPDTRDLDPSTAGLLAYLRSLRGS